MIDRGRRFLRPMADGGGARIASLPAALLLTCVLAEHAAAVDGVELVCPCGVEMGAGGAVTVTFGVRNFRPTATQEFSVDFDPADRGLLAEPTGDLEVRVGSLSAYATLRPAPYAAAGPSGIFEAAVSGQSEQIGFLRLFERSPSGGLKFKDLVPLVRDVGAPPDAPAFSTPDFLTDSDGDGVADANERLEGTNPDDSGSVPGESTLDVLVLYDKEYARLHNNSPFAKIHHLMTVTDLIYRDSGTNIRLRTVGMAESDLDTESGEHWSVRQAPGLALGELHGADLILQLFGGQPAGWPGAWAPLNGRLYRGYMPAEFWLNGSVAMVSSNTGTTVVAHEIGHMLGLSHSHRLDDGGTFRWARGHSDRSGGAGTVMAYRGVELPFFSDPDTECRGAPCGVARDEWAGADAVAALNAVRFQVARWRQAKPDRDGDGFVDPVDAFPQDAAEWRDTDGDGVGDGADSDDDGDGVADRDDPFPLDPSEWSDIDGDGIGDNADTELPAVDTELSAEDVLIPDPALRALVERALGLPASSPIQASELANLTHLQGWELGVRSLEGLQHASALTFLKLVESEVVDLAPLAGLAELTYLDLSYNRVQDLSPLSGLVKMERLELRYNRIADISPLAGMTRLQWLDLYGNSLGDEAPRHLGGLKLLSHLDLGANLITDIAPLVHLRALRKLVLEGNKQLRHIHPLAGMTELRSLNLGGTAVADIAPLRYLTGLWFLSIRETSVVDFSPLQGLKELDFLHLGGLSITDLSRLTGVISISVHLNLSFNHIGDISELIDGEMLVDGASLDLRLNPLGASAIDTHIPMLEARGIDVSYTEPSLVEIPDARLRAAVAGAVGQPGNQFIREEDLAAVRSLDLADMGVADLSGLEQASNLSYINIAGNPIGDLEPLLALFQHGILSHVAVDGIVLNDPSLKPALLAMEAIVENSSKLLVRADPTAHVWLFPPAREALREGLVRVVNRSAGDLDVLIEAVDDAGIRHGPVELTVRAESTVEFGSEDIESGNIELGWPRGVGSGTGDWRLELDSHGDIEVLSYIRTGDGFLSAVHDVAPGSAGRRRVAVFDPRDDGGRSSRLRIVNPGAAAARVRIEGTDDNGQPLPGVLETSIPGGAARSFTASELQSGAAGAEGALGTGAGKWRLIVSSDREVAVLSLLESSTGHVSNLSTVPGAPGR